jgi:hypothetical protein
MRDSTVSSDDAANAEAIAELAEETQQPLSTVKNIYDQEFARLKADARITDFLILFAARRTRDRLSQAR